MSFTVLSSFHFYLQSILKFFSARIWYLSLNKPVNHQQSSIHELELSKEDLRIVMEKVGVFCDGDYYDGELIQESFGENELSRLFEAEPCSLEEVKEAFEIFDENKDGFIDAKDLHTVLCRLGVKEGKQVEECRRMILDVDEHRLGKIGFIDFVKFMEKCFS